MSVKVMGWVWDMAIPANEKLVLLAYADHADHEGNNVFPSIDLIAHKTQYSRRTVQRITRALEKKGLLMAMGGQQGGRGMSAHWSIPVKGAKMSPLPKPERVTPETERVTPVSPEPSVNRQGESLNPPTPRKRKPAHLTADDILATVAIPDRFVQTPEFTSTWYAFLEHRIEIKKPMTNRGAIMMLSKLSKFDIGIAIASLQDSVANGWQGVFPVKLRGNDIQRKVSRQSQARDDMDNYLRRDLEKHIDIGGMHE